MIGPLSWVFFWALGVFYLFAYSTSTEVDGP
jgi:hypothetical protein